MIEKNLYLIRQNIAKACQIFARNSSKVKIVAVSKTIARENIVEAIKCGCKIFGENYLQEAQQKWPEIKQEFPDIQLHFVGHLQSNKAKDAVALFDCIESVDSENLAREIAKQQAKLNKIIDIFIQVNIGAEPQKSGIAIEKLGDFINLCRDQLKLRVMGLMAIPPAEEFPAPYFALLAKLAKQYNLTNLSMGMSSDYHEAIALGATHIRLGTAIFGARQPKANLL